jgi:hypothetical protein
MLGEDTPDAARILHLGHADLKIVEGNALAVEHSEDVVIGLDKELCRVGEWLVVREPGGLRVAVWTDDRQIANLGVEPPRDGARVVVSREKPVFVEQSQRFIHLGRSRPVESYSSRKIRMSEAVAASIV